MNLSSTLIVTNKQKSHGNLKYLKLVDSDCILAREHYIDARPSCSQGVVQFK